MTDDGYQEIAALRAALAREQADNALIRELMNESGGDQLQSLANSLMPGVAALVGVFRWYRERLATAAALLKEYRDEYSHTPRCMKLPTGDCVCGYDAAKNSSSHA